MTPITPTAVPVPPTLRQRLEAILLVPPWRAVALERLYDLLPDCSHDQVRSAIKYLVKRGLVITQGTPRQSAYQGVMGATATPAPTPPREAIIWPAGLQVQIVPTSAHLAARGTFTGVNWTQSLQRPGCQDHLLHPSRRGDQRVPPQMPIIGCVGDLRDKRSLGR